MPHKDRPAYGPLYSDAALERAMPLVRHGHEDIVIEIADAMHDPALGLDRSVCLRDVIEALDAYTAGVSPSSPHVLAPAATFLRERFGAR